MPVSYTHLVNEEELWSRMEGPLNEACRKFAEAREREGENLKKDLLLKLEGLDQMVSKVEERSPMVVQAYREKLEAKVHELLEDSQIDDSRIAAEVVLFSDKICNDEETVRLHSHCLLYTSFSGGVDSAFLLAMAVKYGADVQPYFIKTAFQPEFELQDAYELTSQLGLNLTVIRHDILKYHGGSQSD